MANNDSIEFLKVKAFLYKYTPPFTASSDQTQTGGFAKITQYDVELDPQYFSVYDISDFVSGYNFQQQIKENTFSWSVSLQDAVIPFTVFNKTVRLVGPQLSSTASFSFNGANAGPAQVPKAMANLAQYEDTFNSTTSSSTIEIAKEARGKADAALTDKVGSTITIQPGIRLSDVIQPYDIISVFLYKETVPLENLRGTVTKASGLGTGTLPSFTTFVVNPADPTNANGPIFGGSGTPLTGDNLQTETVLLGPSINTTVSDFASASPEYPQPTLFANELNGFVMKKSVVRNIGSVDMVNVSGNGLTRLFGSTRRLLKSGLMQNSLYSVAQLGDPQQLTAFQNIYAGRTLTQIFADLFQIVYRIDFDFNQIGNSIDVAGTAPQPMVSVPTVGRFDISGLEVGNFYQTNLFTVPPFLLSLMMKRRGFSYREPISTDTLADLINFTDSAKQTTQTTGATPSTNVTFVSQSQIDLVLDNNTTDYQNVLTGKSPVLFNSNLDALRAYFIIIEEVLRDFNPELRTPFEVIDEVKAKTFLEFFERPDGVVEIRPPDYNNTTNVVFSSTLDIVSTEYSSAVESLVSRHKMGYALDALPDLGVNHERAFCDGKLLLQFGFLESSSDANPNVRDAKTDNDAVAQTKESALYKYAEYFLRISNAALNTGSITCNLDPKVRVGMTILDETNFKFGYIVGITKNVSIGGGPVTMALQLAYVRDAGITYGSNGAVSKIQVDTLPSLLDISLKAQGK